MDYALEVYEQYIRNEEFDPFLYNSFEINLTLKIVKPKFEKFYKNLEKFTPRLIKFQNTLVTKDIWLMCST